MAELDYYGPVCVEVDHDKRTVLMTLRHGREPFTASTIERLKAWALSVLEADHPDYTIEDLTTNGG